MSDVIDKGDGFEAEFERAVKRVRALPKPPCPVRTGKLAASYGVTVRGSSIVVGYSVPYAAFVEAPIDEAGIVAAMVAK